MASENVKNNQFNLDDFSARSQEFYETVKSDLESQYKGRYAALDYRSKRYWLGDTASDVLAKAKEEFPDRLFYIVQVGSPTAFSVQSVVSRNLPHSPHDIRRPHR